MQIIKNCFFFCRDCKSGPYTECLESQEILYAWAKDAPPKYLPKGKKMYCQGMTPSLTVHWLIHGIKTQYKDYWNPKRKLGVAVHFLDIIEGLGA